MSQDRSALMNHSPEEEEDAPAMSSYGCGCFRVFGFGSAGGECRSLLPENAPAEWWVVRKLKKVREMSEMVAGPRWKTFIRKVGGYLKRKKQKNNRFQYDPESYALNFDGGLEREEEGQAALGFSARFAMPMAAKEQR